MPRLLHHHDSLLARADGGGVWRVQHSAVSADGRESAVDGGVFVPEEVDWVKEIT